MLDDEALIAEVVDKTAGWSGADIDNLCREAALCALRSGPGEGVPLHATVLLPSHIRAALAQRVGGVNI